jgi:iron only hydrogenase large subunit-like protein/uncharacterized Fe-S cluster-containing protein
MEEGQASVVGELCLSCGTCVRECPQKAKLFRNDIELASRLISSGRKTACSLAPSFAGFFPSWQRRRIPSVLRRLGFTNVSETAVGAFYSALATSDYVNKHSREPNIGTSCPAFVDYVLKYRPDLARYLVPVDSPMVAHAKYLRSKLGEDTAVIFIGPCTAKKAEAARTSGNGTIDCVLTFSELFEWLANEHIEISGFEESGFDITPHGVSRLFPLEGGCVATAGLNADIMHANIIAVSGFESIDAALDDMKPGQFVEPLFCSHGCASGPATNGQTSFFEARLNIMEYNAESIKFSPKTPQDSLELDDYDRKFMETLVTQFPIPKKPVKREATEQEIREIYEKTGKADPINQLDCGACGYPSCRAKAIAVIDGMAEIDMCLPFVKRKALQRIDRIVETSPNGIVTLDEHLNIISMNPAFRAFFQCSNAVSGKPISYLMDPEPFERLLAEPDKQVNVIVNHASYNLVCNEFIYVLPDEHQFIGIFVNITSQEKNQSQLDALRERTVIQARELLEQQLLMAETVASALGENAARAESLLEHLMEQAVNKD